MVEVLLKSNGGNMVFLLNGVKIIGYLLKRDVGFLFILYVKLFLDRLNILLVRV